MTDTALTHIQTRLQRVERQNHVLIALLCAAAGLATFAATKHGPTVIAVDEVRAHRISLLDDGNAIVHTWRGGVSGSYFEN